MAKRDLKFNNVKDDNIKDVTENEEVIQNEVTDVKESIPKTTVGIVSNCSRLNVREEAKIKSKVITVIKENTKVIVSPDKSTKEWYYVTVKKLSGYCMKKYISI